MLLDLFAKKADEVTSARKRWRKTHFSLGSVGKAKVYVVVAAMKGESLQKIRTTIEREIPEFRKYESTSKSQIIGQGRAFAKWLDDEGLEVVRKN